MVGSVLFLTFLLLPTFSNLSAFELDPGGNRVKEGRSAYEDGNFSGSLEKYKEAEPYFPGDPRMEFNRGSAEYKSGGLDKALRHFEKSLESKDAELRSKAHFNLGNTYLRLGDRKRAAEHYLRSLKENPNMEAARKNLEWLRKMPPPPPPSGSSQNQEEEQGKEGQQGSSQEKNQSGNLEQRGNDKSGIGKESKSKSRSKSEAELDRMMDALDLESVKRKSQGSRNREVFW
ncbi:TPR repeat-containing protein BatC [Leptospira perolatii]|uniref:TPR repeat-containing protein BatC n=1 Tax=Leptospira perolatii TaxID=2023191 RepID=UPI003C6D6CAC